MYLDATGDSGWPQPFGKSTKEWYVLAGIALDPENDLCATHQADTLLKKYIPDSVRDEWPDQNYEIKYHDIQRGKNIFSTLDDAERMKLSNEIFDLITSINPVIFATAVHKTQLKKVYGENAEIPRLLAMRATVHRFDMYLDREDQVGLTIADEENHKNDDEIRKLIYKMKREGASIPSRSHPTVPNYLDQLLNTATMSPSEMSTGIQLADVCCRSIWAHFQTGQSQLMKM